MGKSLYPDIHIPSIYDIDLSYLKSKGITNMIIDIDNTLSKWGSKMPDEKVCSWIKGSKASGFKICILSNSSNKRISLYCSELNVLFCKNVRKPLKSSFINAMNLLESQFYNTCVVGDQIFTDILGGNKCSLFTILVNPIDRNEFILTRIIRIIEAKFLKRYYMKR
ncbi:mitochondrial PGP phosphatase [Oxobacter pfennigii]|uniref:Mitochondrial PGP phosphatase n=1 Tax=Oxobacter pfennigii TaxID=36849 RepID=A0A0P9AHJ1_9CLOT|nr:YqeG family HAD IIIA-type phosphatase [Oxobacter pfennigii]KPU44942.1 mitochondrial PGP phosphatase [Oxobacter pfennigii]